MKKGKIPQLLVKIMNVWNSIEQIRKFPMTLGKMIEALIQIKKSPIALLKKAMTLKSLKQMDKLLNHLGKLPISKWSHGMKQRVLERLAYV